MELSFDLDGVIADTDNGMLGLLHRAARDGIPGARNSLEQYYARRRIVLDPREFLGCGDCFHIVTGRVPSAQGVTSHWVQRWFGWGQSSQERLHFVSSDEVERLLTGGLDEEAYERLAQSKLSTILALDVDVHFENNPLIVLRLRQAGVKAIQVGGGLA